MVDVMDGVKEAMRKILLDFPKFLENDNVIGRATVDRAIVLLAASTSPLRYAYLGASGMRTIPIPSMEDHRKLIPVGIRHD